jgi:hypothetical protein
VTKILIKNVSSSGFNEFLVEKSIEIVSRTLQIKKNISIHPDEKVRILDETKQLNINFLIGLKRDDKY